MRGHDWKRVTLPEHYLGNVMSMLRFRWLPPNPDLSKCKTWECGRCGALIAAVGGMSQSDARRKAKIPFDCDLKIVSEVHET